MSRLAKCVNGCNGVAGWRHGIADWARQLPSKVLLGVKHLLGGAREVGVHLVDQWKAARSVDVGDKHHPVLIREDKPPTRERERPIQLGVVVATRHGRHRNALRHLEKPPKRASHGRARLRPNPRGHCHLGIALHEGQDREGLIGAGRAREREVARLQGVVCFVGKDRLLFEGSCLVLKLRSGRNTLSATRS